MTLPRTFLVLVATVVSFDALAADFLPLGSTFQELGGLSLSRNGEFVIGTQVSERQSECAIFADCATATNAVRWSRKDGLEPLLDFDRATAISNNGEVAVGRRRSTGGFGPFLWNVSTGIIDLGELRETPDLGYATDVSADGRIVVGGVGESLFATSYGGNPEAFVWSAESGVVGLGDLDGGSERSFATAVSADGSVVVGEATSAGSTGGEAFVWTIDEGMIGLGEHTRLAQSTATDVSSDGLVVVGFGWGAIGPLRSPSGFRYRSDGNATDHLCFTPLATDATGKTIVGTSGGVATIWFESGQSQVLQEVLASDYGLAEQLEAWTLETAVDISADGRTIVGFGTNPSGQLEAWGVVIPEPSSAVIALMSCGVLSSVFRTRSSWLHRCRFGRVPKCVGCVTPLHLPNHARMPASASILAFSNEHADHRN